MEKQKYEKGTYITLFNSYSKNESINNKFRNQKNQNTSPNRKNIFKTIESYSLLHNKKLRQIKFPSIKFSNKNIISSLFDSEHKSLKKISKKNLLDISNKNNPNIDYMISKIKKRKNKMNKKNKYLQININSHSFDKINRKNKSNKSNSSSAIKRKNEINKLHVVKSATTIKKLYINNLEFNIRKQKSNIRNISPKNNSYKLENSFSAKSQHIYSPKGYHKRVLSNLESFRKKEKQLERSKKQLYVYSLKQFSPRLLRQNDKNENMKNNINNDNNINRRNERTKLQTFIFKNKAIPYADKIDLKQIKTYLPPIKLGCRYSIQEKSSEVIKREEFNEAINKIINENKKKHKNKINLTKKDILIKIRNRNLKFCDFRVHKTEEDVSNTKNKIIKNYNNLKLSLNQFDNWNSPENSDNLFG